MRVRFLSVISCVSFAALLLASAGRGQGTPAVAVDEDALPLLGPRPPHDWIELHKGDVVAFLGGESAVLEGERGHLESLIVASHPDARLRFRNLAWEGDTV